MNEFQSVIYFYLYRSIKHALVRMNIMSGNDKKWVLHDIKMKEFREERYTTGSSEINLKLWPILCMKLEAAIVFSNGIIIIFLLLGTNFDLLKKIILYHRTLTHL